MFGEAFKWIWFICGYGLLTMFLILVTGLLGGWRGRRTVPAGIGAALMVLPVVAYIVLFFMGIDARGFLWLGFIFWIVTPLIYIINIALLFFWKKGEWLHRNWKKDFRGTFTLFMVLLVIWIVGLVLSFLKLP